MGPTNRNTVLVTEDGRSAYASLLQQSVQWRTYVQNLPGTSPHGPWLLEDLFYALYESEVELNPRVPAELHRNFAVLAALLPMAAFRRLRQQTVGDAVAAAMAVRRFADDLLAEEGEGDVERGRNPLARLWSLAGLSIGWRRDRHPREDAPLHERRDEAGERGAGARTGTGRPDGPEVDDVADERRRPRYRALKALDEAARDAARDRHLRGVWGIEPGVRSVHALDDIWVLVDAVRALPGFEALTDAFVEMRQLMQPATTGRRRRRRPGTRGFERLEGWTRGSDIGRVAPEELVRLLDEDLASLFHEAHEHGRLLQERYGGKRPDSPGPLICCLDVSRSMNTIAARGRERFVWAKGIGLALLDVARRARRPYLGICFSSEYDLATFDVPVGGYCPEIAIDLARCDFDGGTHFRAPLLQAVEYLQRHRRGIGMSRGGREQGQIVFVTDGEAALPDAFVRQFKQARETLGFRVLTVFIDGQQPELVALSDTVFSVHPDRIESWERTSSGLARAIGAGI